MKKLIILLFLTFSVVGFAQHTEHNIDFKDHKATYKRAAKRAAEKTNIELGLKSNPSYSELIITNDPSFPKLLKEFYDGARYYKIDYKKQLEALTDIKVVDRPEDYAFLGSVSQDKKSIQMNAMLLEYPALFKIIFFNLMGQVYDLNLEKDSNNHDIMSAHWFMDDKHEKTATYLNKTHSKEKKFFEKLAKIHPLETSL